MLELPCRHTILKQQINLTKCSVLCLRESEVAPDVAKQICTRIEKSSFGAPIPAYCSSVPVKYAGITELTNGGDHSRRD